MPYADPVQERAHTAARYRRVKSDPELLAEKQQAERERYANASPEKREELHARSRAWHAANPRKAAFSAWKHLLKKRYGLTVEQYEEMLVAQKGVCAICCLMQKDASRLSVDHCHETGQVRGLLCDTCNFAIGQLGHDRKLLIRAAEYLATYEGV